MEIPSGLMNMGNTCYLNTLLQCMVHSEHLRTYLLKKHHCDDSEFRNHIECYPLLIEFGLLFHQMWELKQSLVPKRFLTIMHRLSPDYLSYGHQQDINESWCWLIDQLQKEHEKIPVQTEERLAQTLWSLEYLKVTHSIVEDARENWDFHRQCINAWSVFHKKRLSHFDWIQSHEGLLVNQVCCKACGKIYHNYEPFTSLTLEMPENKDTCHLSDCFQSYLKTEVLNQHHKEWKCDDCEKYTPADKIIRFWKVPECLVILLKRFTYTMDGGQRKINTGIDIPFEFEFMMGTELLPIKNKKYKLKAMGNHYGNIHGGHYDSICLHNDQWWRMDDLHMEHIHETKDQWSKGNTTCYMLFYERCPLSS